MSSPKSRDTQLTCSTCGYQTKITTAPMAAYGLRRHSCAMTFERARRTQARIDRENASGVRRECNHKRANHQHGTYAAFVLDLCRCRPCRNANRNYEATRVRAKLYGTWAPYVDAQPAREHIEALRAAGLGCKRIAALAGIPASLVGAIVYGRKADNGTYRPPTKRVRKATAEAILAVSADLESLGARIGVDPIGTRRRMQALVCRGWSIAKLGRHLGIVNIHLVLSGTGPVSAATALAVRETYERMWDAPVPEGNQRERIAASRARNYAAKRGWVPPLAWDDDTIDDPAARPDGITTGPVVDDVDDVVVERLLSGADWRALKASRGERLEAARIAFERGLSTNEIDRRLGLRHGRDWRQSA